MFFVGSSCFIFTLYFTNDVNRYKNLFVMNVPRRSCTSVFNSEVLFAQPIRHYDRSPYHSALTGTVSRAAGRPRGLLVGAGARPAGLRALARRAGAAHVLVVVAQRAARQPHAVHVEPLVAAAVALHPVHLLACTSSRL